MVKVELYIDKKKRYDSTLFLLPKELKTLKIILNGQTIYDLENIKYEEAKRRRENDSK